jgi:hypothetical protein
MADDGSRARAGALSLAAFSLGIALVFTSRAGFAQATAVPAPIQAGLLAKLEAYDRNFAARAGQTAHVLILTKPGNAQSGQEATDMKVALAQVPNLGGLPHEEVIAPYAGADALAERCRSEHLAVVYLAPGFDDDVEAIAKALNNVSVLTMSADSAYVQKGVVLAVELASGKPKLAINLEQAKRQSINFTSDVLRLMVVYR